MAKDTTTKKITRLIFKIVSLLVVITMVLSMLYLVFGDNFIIVAGIIIFAGIVLWILCVLFIWAFDYEDKNGKA